MAIAATAAKNALSGPPARRLDPTHAAIEAAEAAPVARDGPKFDYDRLTLWGVGLPLFAEVFLQNFAIPLGSKAQISVTIPFGFAGLALLLLTGRAVIEGRRFILYCVMVAAIVLSQLFGEGSASFSTSSLIFMIGTYVIYIFRLRSGPGNFRATLQFYQRMAFIVAIAGVAQYAGQFVLPHVFVFPLESHLGRFLIKGFNHLNPITWGESTFKSNGVFLAEPSLFSQAMALSFIIERLYFRRFGFQVAYLAGLTVSLSGTGLLLLAAAGPFLIYRTGAIRLLYIILPVGIMLLLFGGFLHLEIMADRAAEFNSNHTSGFARFISIFYLLEQFIFIDPTRFLFGMGAHSIEVASRHLTYLAHDPTWGKLLFEYGLLGTLGFFPFILYSMLAHSASRFLAACLAFAYFFLGGNLLGPFYNFLIVALVAWQRPDPTLTTAPPQATPSASHSFFQRPRASKSLASAAPVRFGLPDTPQRLPRFCP